MVKLIWVWKVFFEKYMNSAWVEGWLFYLLK